MVDNVPKEKAERPHGRVGKKKEETEEERGGGGSFVCRRGWRRESYCQLNQKSKKACYSVEGEKERKREERVFVMWK